MRRLVLVVATTVGLLLALPMGAAAHECPDPASFGELHADLATGGAIPEEHLPGEHFGFAGFCLHLEPLPDVNPGT